MESEGVRYISYLRVSTSKQGRSGLGLEAQKSIIAHFAKVDRATIIREVVEIESGKDSETRPLLKNAIAECNKQGYTLIVAKLDRLSRDVSDTFAILKELNGKLKSCDIPTLDSFTLAIFSGLAQRERELISLRTKQALKALKDRGVKLGSGRSFTLEDQNKGSAAASEKAKIFKENRILIAITEKCLRDGLTFEQTATVLNETGLKTFRGLPFNKLSVYRLKQYYNIAL